MTDEVTKASVAIENATNRSSPTKKYFSPRLERVRKHLDKAAEVAAKRFVTVIEKQAEQGKADAAIWLLEHTESVNGERPISQGIDKQKDQGGDSGVKIVIGGFGFGQPSLPPVAAKVIDVTPERNPEESPAILAESYKEPCDN